MNLLVVHSKREKIINKIIEKENELVSAIDTLNRYIKDDNFSTYNGKLNAIIEIGRMNYSIDILKELRTEVLGVFDNE